MATIVKIDPICGMALEPETAAVTCTYAGWTYLFCCRECLDIFMQSPNDCIVYVAHNGSGHVGYFCPSQRKTWQAHKTGVFR